MIMTTTITKHGHDEHEHHDHEDHHHDDDITSVGIVAPGDVDEKKLGAWLGELLRTEGPEHLSHEGHPGREGPQRALVFQGVHMLMDGRPDRPWGDEPRENPLIFIGRNLDRQKLNEGFASCRA